MEHDPAGQEDDRERKDDRQQREAGKLQPDGRQLAQADCDDQAHREGRERDEDCKLDHGENL